MKISRIFKITMLAAAILLGCGLSARAAKPTAQQLVSTIASKINGSSGVKATFRMTVGSQTVNGTMTSSGKKFALESNAASSWYDGKTLYTYNPASAETTLVTPTASELAETNPLSVISAAATKFTAAYAKKQTAGSNTIVLTPKAKGTGIRRAVLIASADKNIPQKLDLTMDSGERIVISISSVQLGIKPAASVFTYPKARYPKARLVDLR